MSTMKWIKITFYLENKPEIFTEVSMISVPMMGDFIKFSSHISDGLFQVINSPTHQVGISQRGMPYHFPACQIRQVPENTTEESDAETSTHI